jgi:hypothetical protein
MFPPFSGQDSKPRVAEDNNQASRRHIPEYQFSYSPPSDPQISNAYIDQKDRKIIWDFKLM